MLFISADKANAQTAALKLVLGNPSNAVADINTSENYLVIHNGFILSYNKARGGAKDAGTEDYEFAQNNKESENG